MHSNLESYIANDFVSTFGILHELNGLSQMKHLSIKVDPLSDQWFESIGHCLPQLKTFVLFHKKPITDELFAYLSQLKALKSLKIICESMEKIKVSSLGVEKLTDNCQDLRKIRIDIAFLNDIINEFNHNTNLTDQSHLEWRKGIRNCQSLSVGSSCQ